MSKKRTADRRLERHSDPWSPDSDDSGPRPKSNRKHLKELDRELQRFISRVSGLETRLDREEANEKADLILETEELHREALLLRAEIREALATGKADLDHVVEGVDDSWEQLLETLEELKEGLKPARPEKTRPQSREPEEEEFVLQDDEELEDFDLDEVAEDDDDFDLPAPSDPRKIHRPRTGPKR